jgi:hypothetical protein
MPGRFFLVALDRTTFRNEEPMSGALSPHSKLQRLLRQNISGIQFVNLCQEYGLTGITNQWLSRAMKKNDFARDTQEMLRPLIERIEKLVEHFQQTGIPFSFEDPKMARFWLTLIDDGVRVNWEVPKNSTTE